MKKITYNNKQYVLNDPQYPVEETVTDADMNEIKEVVNFNADETLEENIKIKEQLEQTKDALINITTPKSSNINVKDSSDLNAKVDVYGISRQKTRSGKNKWVNKIQTQTVNGITVTRNQDGSLTFNGTATAVTTFYFETDTEGTVEFKEGETYTISGINSGESQIYQTCMIANYGPGTEETRTLTVATTRKANSSNSYIQFASGTVLNNYTIKPQIELGEVATSYEQYGASPTPEYPSEIENVTGDIDITICNKNLFDKTKITDNNYLNENGGLTSNNLYCVSDFIDVLENETYFLPTRGTTRTKFYDKNKQALTNTWDIADGDKSFIVPIKVKYIRFSINKETVNIDTFQFERNNMKTDYIEHEQQTITFPLSEGQKLYDKDYPASDGIHHVRKQIELVGTENWQLTARDEYYAFWLAYNGIGMIDRYNKKICTHFSYYSQIFTEAPVNSICENSGSPNMIIFKVDFCTTIEAFKTYLAQQKQAGTPVIVEYELATEEIEAYTEEQQAAYNQLQNAKTYKTVTNVFTDKALLEFKYIADTETWVVNLVKNEIANTNQQILEIAGGN